MRVVVDGLKRGKDIRLGWRVASVDYSHDAYTTVTSTDGRSLRASRVVVSVPVPVLKDGDIRFTPLLPLPKTHAFATVCMAGAVKVVLKFVRPFWPADCHGVICGHSLAPEFWMSGSEPVGALVRPDAPHVPVHAEANGSQARSRQAARDAAPGGMVAPAPTEASTGAASGPFFTVTAFATSVAAARMCSLPRPELVAQVRTAASTDPRLTREPAGRWWPSWTPCSAAKGPGRPATPSSAPSCTTGPRNPSSGTSRAPDRAGEAFHAAVGSTHHGTHSPLAATEAGTPAVGSNSWNGRAQILRHRCRVASSSRARRPTRTRT